MSYLRKATGASSDSGEDTNSPLPDEASSDQPPETEVESQNWVATIGLFGVFAALICKPEKMRCGRLI